MRRAFTLIEILVVVTIIGILAATTAVSYSQFSKQSRDARRKTDIELIRGALEMYKSIHNEYPDPISFSACVTSPQDLVNGTNTYLKKIPNDPKCPATHYIYVPETSVALGPYTDYVVCARLEQARTDVTGLTETCATAAPTGCNYCFGPFGEITAN